MQPSTRIVFNYPIYALDLLPDGTIAIAGGGGLMKSGIPNKCALLSFDPQKHSLSERASIDLPDAPISLAAAGTTLHSIIGVGVKNFTTENTLTPQSTFRHDLRVSATQDQSAIAISADLSTLVVASDEGHVVSLSLPRYEVLFSAQLHTQGVTDLVISQDGALVATTSRDRSAYIWSSRTGQIDQILKPVMPPEMRTHIRAIRFCLSNPDIIFTIESNPRKGGWIAAWQRPPRTHGTAFKPIASLKVSADALTTCSVNNDGTLISASSSEGHVMLLRWDGSSISLVWSTETKSDWFSAPKPPHDLPITGLHFSESGEYFFSASADYSVAAWPIKRPTDWRGIRRFAFWVVNLLILIFAILVAEDHAIPNAIRHRRTRLQPYLEPQLSQIQGYVRPFIRDRQAQIQPYLTGIQDALQPRVKLTEKRMRPHPEKAQMHRTPWKSKQRGTCDRVSRDYSFFSSSPSSGTKERAQSHGQESFDDSDGKKEPDLQRSGEGISTNFETRGDKKRSNENPSRYIEEPGYNIDNRRIHGRSDKLLPSPRKDASMLESRSAVGISHHKLKSFEKLIRSKPTTAMRFGEKGRCTKRTEKEEHFSPDNEVSRKTATETIDGHEDLHSKRRRRLAKSKTENAVENQEPIPRGIASGSHSSVPQSGDTIGLKVPQLQRRENGHEQDSLGVIDEREIVGNGPLSSRELPNWSKTALDMSTVSLESSKDDEDFGGRNHKGDAESKDSKNVVQERCVTSGDRSCPTVEETGTDPVLAGAGLQHSETVTVSDETMEGSTSRNDREVLGPPGTSSRLFDEGTEDTMSSILVSGENLLQEVHEGIDSILAESAHVFMNYSPRRDSNS